MQTGIMFSIIMKSTQIGGGGSRNDGQKFSYSLTKSTTFTAPILKKPTINK